LVDSLHDATGSIRAALAQQELPILVLLDELQGVRVPDVEKRPQRQ
jgi:hypothetical protein